VFWCSRSLTDGRIAADELASISKRANKTRAAKLVERGLWHPAGTLCASDHCPEPGEDGWVIHDYLQYQPSRAKVVSEQQMKAERQKRWVARQAERRVSPASKDIAPSPSPPRREAGTDVPEKRPAAVDAFGAAGHRSAKPCPTCGNKLDSAYHLNTCQRTQSA